jgi:stearoyl-CoA desaturase (delta-9 desaturase)
MMTTSNTIGVQIFHVVAIVGSIIAISMYGIDTHSILLAILGYFLYGCLGIVVMFHRNLTHNSYNTFGFIKKLFSVLGSLAGTGSPLAWVAIHINHHLHSDKSNDPHSPVHKGLSIFLLDYHKDIAPATKWRMKHLITDPFQQLLHRYYFGILVLYSLVLFLLGGFWLMVFFHWIPAAVTGIMSNVVNFIGHSPSWLGSFRRYNLNDASTNNWIWAVPSWGETWHNNHHRYPKRFNCGEKWWEIDISAYIIKLIKI